MKKIIYLFSIISICFFISGCAKKEELDKVQKGTKNNTYKTFEQDYQYIAEKFKLKGFKKTGDGETKRSCIIFPENNYFEEKKDMIDEDFSEPVKKNLFYIDKKRKILIYITHMYLKKPIEKNLITADLPADEYKANKTLQLPYFEEYFFSYHNTLVSLKIMHIGDSSDVNKKFSDITIQAFKEYVKLLK